MGGTDMPELVRCSALYRGRADRRCIASDQHEGPHRSTDGRFVVEWQAAQSDDTTGMAQ